MSSTVVFSKPFSENRRTAAWMIASRVRCFLRSRSGAGSAMPPFCEMRHIEATGTKGHMAVLDIWQSLPYGHRRHLGTREHELAPSHLLPERPPQPAPIGHHLLGDLRGARGDGDHPRVPQRTAFEHS